MITRTETGLPRRLEEPSAQKGKGCGAPPVLHSLGAPTIAAVFKIPHQENGGVSLTARSGGKCVDPNDAIFWIA